MSSKLTIDQSSNVKNLKNMTTQSI